MYAEGIIAYLSAGYLPPIGGDDVKLLIIENLN